MPLPVPAGSLQQRLQSLCAAHPEQTGLVPLTDSHEAFAARVLLAQQAQRQLDLQYYIWRNDRTGTILFDAVVAAAERGVKVRLLLDDHNTVGLDSTLIGLQQHPNIEVKLFNPLRVRWPRSFNYLLDFRRVQRRMHNKAWIVDQQVVISGGRNIGDEYFAAHEQFSFADLDALFIGSVVTDVVAQFELYWQSPQAQPLSTMFAWQTKTRELLALRQRAAVLRAQPAAQDYLRQLQQLPLLQQIALQQVRWYWAPTTLVSDHPSKILGQAKRHQLITYQLRQAIGEPQQRLFIVSPYFVPTLVGVAALRAMAARGVEVQILTNALEATDVAVVHAGYGRWRRTLLQSGIRLFELQKVSAVARRQERRARRQRLKGKDWIGGSASSLHAKTFASDGQRLFVGSFNFDPRSAQLNTELGFVIHSEALAQQIEQAFRDTLPDYAYEVQLEQQQLVWYERLGQRRLRYRQEPGVSWWRRLGTRMLGWLPIDWLL